MLLQSLATAATLLSFAGHGNRIELKLNQGTAELAWVTPSTFRLRHSLTGALPQAMWSDKETVAVTTVETPAAVTFSSKFIQVTVQKHGLLVKVRKADGGTVMADLTEARVQGGGVTWERAAGAGERYYGLGPRTDMTFDLRGKVIRNAHPMLISTGGYGEYHPAKGPYTFDVAAAKADRYRIDAPAVDYYFFYGPLPKEVLEEAAVTRSIVTPTPTPEGRAGSWETLRDAVLRIVHASMSGILMPAFDMAPYANAPAPLLERARQFGQVVAGLTPETAALTDFRRQLTAFFSTYAEEARDRGFPFFHPMPFQFAEDKDAPQHADQFMLGDEMLIAPIYTASNSRQVYLPRGIWTNFETEQEYKGRQTITVESKGLPMFARNGTIIPLNGLTHDDAMQLHYFPSLGAEFFLLETEISDWSQVHAAPAVDVIRFQIESKVDRVYEWVLHHAEKPAKVGFGERAYTEVKSAAALKNGAWFYDAARKRFYVRVSVGAGEDNIINLVY